MSTVKTGSQTLIQHHLSALRGARIGLITNPTGLDATLRPTLDLLLEAGLTVTALFGPEHGIRGDAPAGAHIASGVDPLTGIPVYSLYGPTRKPTPEMLDAVDVLLFEIQDAGARFYTYTWTLALCMEAAAELGKRLVVLDRPNPIGGEAVEGGLLQPGLETFVGLRPIPVRHGMTHGELAQWLNGRFGPACDLTVIPMEGWERSMYWEETGLPFVPPSPATNMPSMLQLYPGTCFIEGVNLSEGRGTSLPFQVFGAPWLHERAVVAELTLRCLPGVLFRPHHFTPLTSKHEGAFCRGVQIHVLDKRALRPVELGAHILDVVRQLHPEQFEWVKGSTKYWIDLVSGSARLREAIDAGASIEPVLAAWREEAAAFKAAAAPYLLYA
ncbi:MAG TPA: DUF1343 domain-containing protein [Symbiobacteriaceae bacterium]|nr:DUF1343 domain-containing protein [Symbiobacteriaceae bacterium]